MSGSQCNILLIVTDQHRLSAVGCYDNASPCRTPHIDSLAAEGVRFENAYTCCPVCSPTRASMMTGLYPHAHGITSNCENLGCTIHTLEDRPSLLPRRAHEAGYSPGFNGKWHASAERDFRFCGVIGHGNPTDYGFEGFDYPGHGDGGQGFSAYQSFLASRGLEHRPTWPEATRQVCRSGVVDLPAEATVEGFLAQTSIDLMDRLSERDRPWLMWHNFWGPHEPLYVPEEFVEPYRRIEIPPWPNFDWPAADLPGPHRMRLHPEHRDLTWRDWADAIRYYYAFASLIDERIGVMLDHLRRTGELDRTVIIFTADHGDSLGSHGGLIDKGWHHFEEIHRIPMIVRFPDGRHAGRVVDAPTSWLDIYPTLCEIMQSPAVDGFRPHGQSLLPRLRGDAAWDDAAVSEFGGVNNLAATVRTLRFGRWKYGWAAGSIEELYDLDADPQETVNVIGHDACQSELRSCRSRLAKWMQATDDPAMAMYVQHVSREG